MFPADLNSSEQSVLEKEMSRKWILAWYRNPSRSSQDSLGVVYGENDQLHLVRPDFIFFAMQDDGTITADIVDPHGTHLSDALPKIQGLAKYAETHSKTYRQIETVAKIEDKLRVLDLTDAKVRQKVAKATDAKSLYESALANEL